MENSDFRAPPAMHKGIALLFNNNPKTKSFIVEIQYIAG
jgi:hypothetical protein